MKAMIIGAVLVLAALGIGQVSQQADAAGVERPAQRVAPAHVTGAFHWDWQYVHIGYGVWQWQVCLTSPTGYVFWNTCV